MPRYFFFILPLFTLHFALLTPAFAKTHVFWYNALANGYRLTDCNPGPCIPAGAIIHEGAIVTGSRDLYSGTYHKNLRFYYLPSINERASSYVWSYDLNTAVSGRAAFARLRAEYLNAWSQGAPVCVGGRLFVRCGVFDFQKVITAYGGLDTVFRHVTWVNAGDDFRDSMGFNPTTKKLMAEEIKTLTIPGGKRTRTSPGKLDGRFFEIDITNQVNWILAHPGGQYGIACMLGEDERNTGRISTYAFPTKEEYAGVTSIRPWTQDANTCHILIEEDEQAPLVFAKQATSAQPPLREGIRWAKPEPYAVIRTNSIPMALEVTGERTIRNITCVRFYSTFVTNKDVVGEDSLIGIAYAPPFSCVWNCIGIPDQNIGKLGLGCEVFKKDGNDSSILLRQFVLDRNDSAKQNELISNRAPSPVFIDGDLQEWPKRNSVHFGGRDNKVTVRSLWDHQNLYFAIQVIDTNVISSTPAGSSTNGGLIYRDEVEIFISPSNAKKEMMEKTDKQFLIAAAGMTFTATRDRENITENLKPNVTCAVKVSGTLSNDADKDTGYTIEYAIPWELIGIVPAEHKRLGLELWNTDSDILNVFAQCTYYSWSGTHTGNLQNPSEWGTLVLEKRRAGLGGTVFAIIGALLVLVLAAVVIKKRQKVTHRGLSDKIEVPLCPPEKEEIKKAKAFIAENFTNTELSRESVAAHVGLSPNYFSTFFKDETGEGFIEYLNRYRIEKATDLLINSQLRISEIADKIGFSNLEVFAKTFKKAKKISPSDFRAENQPKSDNSTVK